MPPKKSTKKQPQDAKSSASQLAALMEALKNIPRDSIILDPAMIKMNFFKELDRLNPPTFDGVPDPLVSENWLCTMDRMFDILGVPEEYRVSFAVYYLRMHAEVWWNSEEPNHDIAHMDWENFKLLFRKYYFNNAQQVKVVRSYVDLVQGEMPRKKSSNQQPKDAESTASQLAALMEVLKNIPLDSIIPDHAMRKMNFFKELDRLNPPMFDGGPDPLVSENWLCKMARMFDTLGVPEEYRVSFAVYYLRMHAEVWWNSEEPYHDIAHMDWENFKLLFRKYYFNNAQQEKILRSYYDLVQGDMTVLDYFTRFRELLLCIEGIDSSRRLIIKFQMCLHPTIRLRLSALKFNSIPEVVDAAQRVEAVLAQNHKNKRDKSNKRKITKENNSLGPVRGSGGSSCGRYGPYTCYGCGRQGHVRKDCPMSQENAPQRPPTSNQISDTLGSSSSVSEGFSGDMQTSKRRSGTPRIW